MAKVIAWNGKFGLQVGELKSNKKGVVILTNAQGVRRGKNLADKEFPKDLAALAKSGLGSDVELSEEVEKTLEMEKAKTATLK